VHPDKITSSPDAAFQLSARNVGAARYRSYLWPTSKKASIMSATGIWKANIISPMANSEVLFDIVETDGAITGTATAEGETVTLVDGTADGSALSWMLSITKPMKMSFRMNLTQDGESWTGTAKAKIFPAAKVTGVRVS
jgi:hypothetical protein